MRPRPACSPPRLKGAGEGRGSGGRAGGGRGGRQGAEAGPPVPSLLASHSDSAEVRRSGAGNKGAAWGGERVGRGRAPGRLPEDPGGRKPKCHLNSTPEAGAWDPSAGAAVTAGARPTSSRRVLGAGGPPLAPCAPAPARPPRDPSGAPRCKGSSSMKSKKGKAPRAAAPGARVPGKRARRPAPCSGREGLGGLASPGRTVRLGPRPGSWLRPRPKWQLRPRSLQTQHEGLLWGDGPLHAAGTLSRHTLAALFVRLPSFIVSAGTPRFPESPRGFSLVRMGGGS